MTDTPIDRESVERLTITLEEHNGWETDFQTKCTKTAAKTLLTLRAALDAAEADRDAAVAAALREAAEYCRVTTMGLGYRGAERKFAGYVPIKHSENYFSATQSKHEGMAYAEAILALLPDAGAALDRYVKERSDEALSAERDATLDAASKYLTDTYGIRALSNPIDRSRIAAIRHGSAISAQGDKT